MAQKLDHVVVGAKDLASGLTYLEEKLGVTVPEGGKHPAMSTHNRVMQSGDDTFFELIAVDPDAPDPGRTRWFTLDDPSVQEALKHRPRALCWVVNTDDLDAVVAASPIDLGEVLELTRGDLTWRLTVPNDGSLTMGGLVPGFLEWPKGPHPSVYQQNLGVRLDKVMLRCPDPDALKTLFKALGIDGLAKISAGPDAIEFQMTTATGTVILD